MRGHSNNEATPNADANSPSSLPQARQPPPCCQRPVADGELFDLQRLMVDRTGHLSRRIDFSPCSQAGVPLPGGVERSADYRWAVDLARVGVDPTVVHRRKGDAVAWSRRFAGSSVIARWLPPAFSNGLDPDTTEGAIDLVYASRTCMSSIVGWNRRAFRPPSGAASGRRTMSLSPKAS